MGLVWNSMMSMAGGWFFLSVCEAFKLKVHGEDRNYSLPGIGSYVSVAVEKKRYDAMLWAILAMIIMIVLLDQLLWRPIVVWAQKFRLEEGAAGPAETSWFLRWLRHSRIVAIITSRFRRRTPDAVPTAAQPTHDIPPPVKRGQSSGLLSYVLFAGLLLLLGWGAWRLIELLSDVTRDQWLRTVGVTMLTLVRVFIAVGVGTLWTVPAGIAIGLSPRLSRMLQPIIQIAASFPAPMLFPIVIVVLNWAGVHLNFGSIVLMLLGTQWYILFNVVAGAMAIPADLREAANSFGISGWLRWWKVYIPSIFPFLVTGWVTAAGGAWNASIVAEFVKSGNETQTAAGIGAQIYDATENEQYALLAASTLVLSLVVVGINRTLWRYCYRLAQTRFSASK
jgi:NitT/TauT family transport system permease protein